MAKMIYQKNIKKYEFLGVCKLIFQGVPLRLKPLGNDWDKIDVPKFPVFFTILSMVLYALAFGYVNYQSGYETSNDIIIMYALQESVRYGIIIFLSSAVLYAVSAVIIRGGKKCGIFAALVGARKVTYFSSFFQPFLFSFLILIYGSTFKSLYDLPILPIFIDLLTDILYPMLLIGVIFLSLLRIIYALKTIFLETSKHYVFNYLVILCCFDSWYCIYTVIGILKMLFLMTFF